MREDLKKIVFMENDKKNDLMADSVFRVYAKRQDLGKMILKGLFDKTVLDENEVRHFILDDVEQRTGFLSDVYGCVGVFSLMNRMNIEPSKTQKKDLIKTIYTVLEYMKNEGFTMNPYTKEGDSTLFKKKVPFYGAMTWSLSLLANINLAIRNNTLFTDEEIMIDGKTVSIKQDDIYKLVSTIISAFNNGARLENGKCKGWGFTTNAQQPSLFYTYSVLEAFSDFEDSILGGQDIDYVAPESDDENTDTGNRDESLIEYLKNKLDTKSYDDGTTIDGLTYWKANCFEAAKYVWEKADGIIKKNFVGDNFYTNDNVVPEITEADILKSSTSNALFNTLFVVFAGIYGYVNKEDQERDGDNLDEVMDTMREALQNVQKTYELLAQRGLEYIVDSYSLLFQTGIGKNVSDLERLCSSRLNGENIFDSSLLPLLVKSNSMMAFYIQQYPQKQMGQLFEKLFDNISVSTWESDKLLVWDSNKYNVKNTERYLEAVADFYDYFEKYEQRYVQNKKLNEAAIARRLEEEKPRWKQEKEVEIRQEYDKKFDKWKQNENEKHQFEQLFAAEIKRLAAEAFEEKFVGTLNKILDARMNNTEDRLSDFDRVFAEKCTALFFSYMTQHLRPHSGGVSVDILLDYAKNDIDNFLNAYSKQLAASRQASSTEPPHVLEDAVLKK